MVAQILASNVCALQIKQKVTEAVRSLQSLQGITPGLGVILVGDNPASQAYVGHKQRACKEVGIYSEKRSLPDSASEAEIISVIERYNQDTNIHGILLQLPLPQNVDPIPLLRCIHPDKDVDGFHPYNLGALVQRRPRLRPCTPKGIMTLLAHTGEDLTGKHAVIVGASNIVGRPMGLELLLEKCTVTICHRFTKKLPDVIASADILVAAIGKPGVIQSDWLPTGVIAIDVGFNYSPSGKISGDLCFETAKEKAAWITPVPGGVGPMTVASLLENTVEATRLQHPVSESV
eukprot:TRINITY_DN37648_c0_g1_i1.p1 TRINITY_DN37648_c0_g1~~TRINITY_DN37648_c0_g1_i1.p1  ORF type:complete len:290 (+),score=-52.75 TRINITY_DN37648_c0_g1_i1:78-947(+)